MFLSLDFDNVDTGGVLTSTVCDMLLFNASYLRCAASLNVMLCLSAADTCATSAFPFDGAQSLPASGGLPG